MISTRTIFFICILLVGVDLQASGISRSRLRTAGSSFISASHIARSPWPEMTSMSNTGITDMKSDHLCLAISARRSLANNRCSPRWIFFTEPEVGPACEEVTDDWSDPDKPELGQSPTSDKDRWTRASGRIDRGIGHGDADQMDQGQRKTNGDAGKPNRRASVGGTQDNDKKHVGHRNLADQGGKKRIPARRMCFIAVGGKSALNDIKPGFACGDEIDYEGTRNRAENLCDDVR